MTQGRLSMQSALAEEVEAAALRSVMLGASEEVQAVLGITTSEIGGGLAVALTGDPSGYWSKALGFGITEPVTAALVADVCAFWQEHAADQAVLQIAPAALPPDWNAIAAACNLQRGSTWVKMMGSLTQAHPLELSSDLRVGRVPPAQMPQWSYVLNEGTGMAHEIDQLIALTGPPRFRPMAAWDGEQMVAAALLFLHGDTASVYGTATLPAFRRRGAQSALLRLQLQEAAAAGAVRIVAETYREEDGAHNASLHNLRRAGLRELYERPNWIWRRP